MEEIAFQNSRFFAYILRSERDGSYYYGSTADIQKRLKGHNAGDSAYTKKHRPYLLHYVEEFDTKSEARKRELFFKAIAGYCWLKEEKII